MSSKSINDKLLIIIWLGIGSAILSSVFSAILIRLPLKGIRQASKIVG